MPLLAEYAITPDVFDATSYSSAEVCGLQLREIGNVMSTEGLIRDLRAGEWRRLFVGDDRPWHRRGKELVRKLATQGRLVDFPPALTDAPVDDVAWCAEALATHGRSSLTGGVIATQRIKEAYRYETLVAPIDRLDGAAWWAHRRASVRLARNIAEYQRHLEPILRCANALAFVDPHLDPSRPGYREFADLLVGAGDRSPAPLIELHRVCYEGSGRRRQIPSVHVFEGAFRNALSQTIQTAGLRVEVFIWDDFHDRYLISNLIGVSLPNGFDTTNSSKDITTWTRIDPRDRDDIQREFDPASRRHTLRGQFSIP